MTFDQEDPGTELVSFFDGSALVRGDGSPEEEEALLDLLRSGGCDDSAAAGIARALLAQGLTLAAQSGGSEDPRTMGGETFLAMADKLNPN